jgi:hypothetical protein
MVGSKRIPIKIMLKISKVILQLINVVIILSLLVVHFVIKEGSNKDSLFFYAFPLLVIISVILFLSIFLTKKWRRFNFILGSILLIIWLAGSFKIHFPEKISDTDLEIVFWNASHDNDFEMAFKENEGIPDILVLVESKENNIVELQKKYLNYYFYKYENGIDIFSKTLLTIRKEETSIHNSRILNFQTKGINFYAVDLQGGLNIFREGEMGFIDSIIKEKQNTIVLGDFNLPYESVYFKKLKQNFNHAFSEKGNGFRETWFWNIPLLSLDHIWVSKDLEILKTQKINTFKSDHCMLKTYIKS